MDNTQIAQLMVLDTDGLGGQPQTSLPPGTGYLLDEAGNRLMDEAGNLLIGAVGG